MAAKNPARRQICTGRTQVGFTLLEMLIMVIIVLILAAVAMPIYFGSEDKTREGAVKNNMRMVQMAAESYAHDRGGLYPAKMDDEYFCYFPGGSPKTKSRGQAHGPTNPYTRQPEWPILGSVNDVQGVRSSVPTLVGTAGQIEYSPISGPGGIVGYAIRGARKNGLALPGTSPMTTFVLTRQN